MTQFFLAAQAGQGGGGMTSFLIMMVAIFAIMYFFMIKPQQKRQKEIQNFQNSLQEGTQVVTGGGIYGTVKKIDLATGIVEVKIADGVVIKVDKGYVYKDTASTPLLAHDNAKRDLRTRSKSACRGGGYSQERSANLTSCRYRAGYASR